MKRVDLPLVDPKPMTAEVSGLTSARLERALENPATAATVAYYQKGLNRDARSIVDAHFSQDRLETNFKHFPPIAHLDSKQRKQFFARLGALQLTYGCNGACRDCGLDAVAGAREHIPFHILEHIVHHYGPALRESAAFLYWASDPLDYRYTDPRTKEAYTYKEVEDLFVAQADYRPYVSTVVPKGSISVAQQVPIDRLSVMPEHATRINALLPQIPDPLFTYQVSVGNMNLKDGYWGNVGRDWTSESGIGCFNGTLLTSRGAYCVLQNPGLHAASPQKQFVIPFQGNRPTRPAVGDDVREMLRQHMPHHWHIGSSPIPIPAGTVDVEMFCCIDDPGGGKQPLVIVWRGTSIISVGSFDEFCHRHQYGDAQSFLTDRQGFAESHINSYNHQLRQLQGKPNVEEATDELRECIAWEQSFLLMHDPHQPKNTNTLLAEYFREYVWSRRLCHIPL